MSIQNFAIPIAQVTAADPGQDIVVTVANATLALAAGYYKIAAEGAPMRWKLGAVAVTNTTGSFLGQNDQEVIEIPAQTPPATTVLNVIRSNSATADGRLNVVSVRFATPYGRDSGQANPVG